jgi:ubiquinone/menaquinone biosynthesis C-methylase UbiE
MTGTGSHDYFEQVSKEWDGMRKVFFADSVRTAALEALNVKAGDVGADLGAGTGFITEALVDRGLSVIAVDQSQAMLDELVRKFGSSNVDCRLGEAEALPIEDASVDYVFANMYLHHVDDPQQGISEAARILRAGGGLAIVDLDQHDFAFLLEEHRDRWLGFDHGELRRWFTAASLRDVDVAPIGSTCQADSGDGASHASIGIFLASGWKDGDPS